MLRQTARAVPTLAALIWLLAFGVGLPSSGCALDQRDVGVAQLNTAGAGGTAAVVASCGLQCAEVMCPADDACKDYSDLLPPGSCGPNGACASSADCPFTWKPVAAEGAACSCDAAGCKLLPGAPCTCADVCASNACTATDAGSNVCCASACGSNEVCTLDGSACVAAMPCSEDERRCSGALYQHCAQGVWETVTDCAALGCSKELQGCLRSAGQACESAEECGEGACLATADGNRVCCTGACDGSCRRCAAAGTACEEIEDDEACGSIECPTDVCRSYDPPSVTTNRCRAGHCATPAEACTAFEPQRANLECSPSALCDADGNCSQPKKALLASCGSSSECSSAACVATATSGSVCCATACAANQVCSATGSCVLAPVCTNGATQCSGSSFQRCNGGQWTTVLECGALSCSVPRNGCLGGAGDACDADADCGAGRCQPTSSGSSVCCTAACDGACRNCAPSGTTCENLPDDAECGAIPCPADTTCRDFPPSVSSQRCVAGRCGSAAQLCTGTARAVGQVCSATNLCDGAGNCSVPKKALGTPCGSGTECASNSCVESVCCNGACNGTCSTCAGTGICHAPAADSRCSTGLCASQGQCQGPSVACGTETCPASGSVCCSELSAAGDTRVFCVRNTTSCPAPPNFVPDIPISCDQNVDCPPNRVCCMSGTSTSTEVSCKLPQPTPGMDETSFDFDSCAPLNPMLFGNQLCRSPVGTFQCPAFESCTSTNDRLPGFSFCRPD